MPDDLKAMAGPVLEHRLVLSPEAQLQGLTQTEVLASAVASVPVPTGRG